MLFRGRAVMGLAALALGILVWLWSRRLFGPVGGMISLLLYVFSPIVLANGALMTSDTTTALFFLASVWCAWEVLQRVTLGRVVLGGLCFGGLFVSKMSALLLAPMVLVLALARLIDGRPLVLAIGGAREIRRRGGQALVFAAVGVAQLLVIWAVLWGFYGFRYSAFNAEQAGRGQFQRRWELVLGRSDPIDLVGRLALSDAQRTQVAADLQARNAPLDPWAPEKVDAFAAIRRDVLSSGQNRQLEAWLAEPAAEWPARVAEFLRRREWLPEAFVYGQIYAWRFSRIRFAFLNGGYNATGEPWFFPYAFLVKTPLTMFGICGVALAAGVQAGRRRLRPGVAAEAAVWSSLYATLPLWTLLGFYWAAVLAGHLNIGHRHILATYPPLFVLAGAAAWWLEGTGRAQRVLAFVLGGLMTALAAEVIWRYPNYLAYFNVIAGGPAGGYRHLVDSSLDWGQELPAIRAYLDRHRSDGPAYLSYFGMGDPAYYGIAASRLYSAPGQDLPPPLFVLAMPLDRADAAVTEIRRQWPDYGIVGYIPGADKTVQVVMLKNPGALRWRGGTYLISATMLQPINYIATGPLGPWNARYEATYRQLARAAGPLLSDDADARTARLREHSPAEWQEVLTRYEAFRFARLTAYLRQREPDDNINYSVLVYRLSDADLTRALQGPSPELGEDLPKAIQQSLSAGGGR
jgi:hypothetical protein